MERSLGNYLSECVPVFEVNADSRVLTNQARRFIENDMRVNGDFMLFGAQWDCSDTEIGISRHGLLKGSKRTR